MDGTRHLWIHALQDFLKLDKYEWWIKQNTDAEESSNCSYHNGKPYFLMEINPPALVATVFRAALHATPARPGLVTEVELGELFCRRVTALHRCAGFVDPKFAPLSWISYLGETSVLCNGARLNVICSNAVLIGVFPAASVALQAKSLINADQQWHQNE